MALVIATAPLKLLIALFRLILPVDVAFKVVVPLTIMALLAA